MMCNAGDEMQKHAQIILEPILESISIIKKSKVTANEKIFDMFNNEHHLRQRTRQAVIYQV